MKVIIEAEAFFPPDSGMVDDGKEVPVELVGHPDEDLEEWAVAIVHPNVTLKLSHEELRRALRVFDRGRETL